METFEERQKRENRYQYEKWLSCGFKGEMLVNDCGWCKNSVRIEPTDRYVLFDKPRFKASIEYMRLPNGNWIAGSHATFLNHGWAHGLSVWCKQYDTKEGAVSAEIEEIESSLEKMDKKKFVLDAIKSCKNVFKALPPKINFETSTNFVEISLF